MRLLTFDELTAPMQAERLAIHLASLGGATDRRAVGLWRRRSDLYADYVGVFAVEGGHVLGQTYVKRLAYTFADGTETVGAIASVGTHPGRARHGVARRILEEVHRREREAGLRYVSLWTNRSWGAHHLYESLGYRDVYPVPWGVLPHGARPSGRKRGRGVSPGRREDLPELDRFHETRARARLGFCHRPRRFLEILGTLRELDPEKELLVVRDRHGIRGYALVEREATRMLCGELLADTPRVQRLLVAEVERRSRGAAVAFVLSAASDARSLLRRRGYRGLDAGWYVYMACDLRERWSERAARRRFDTLDRRFLCMQSDRF